MTLQSALHRDRRRGSAAERALKVGLGIGALLLAAAYLGCLLYLVAKGSAKIASFTMYPMPLSGVEHEGLMRYLVAACVFGVLAWGALALVRVVATRLG